jgi:putative peptidoglycan lipid II flippase
MGSGNEKRPPSATVRQRIAHATRHFRHSEAHASSRAILRAALTVGGLTTLIRLLSVVSELVVAATFGISEAMDAYNLAIILPTFVINMIAGTLASVLVPVYVRVRTEEGEEAARRYLGNVLVGVGALLLAGSTLAGAVFALVFLPSWDLGQLPLRLMLLSLPLIVVRGLSLIFVCVLNANRRFAFASVTPVFLPAATLGLVLGYGREWGVYSLAWGGLLGSALEFAAVAAAVGYSGLFARPRWLGMDRWLRRTWSGYLPLFLGSMVYTGMWVVTYRMIESVGPGSVASFTYGNKLIALVLELGSLALGTAVLPSFAGLVAAGQWEALRRTLRTVIGTILLGTVPVSLALCFSSHLLVRLLFQRGQFSAADTELVGSIQAAAALQVPCYLINIVAWRLVAALNRNWLNVEATLLLVVVHLSTNYLLMRWLGVVGIALSVSLMFCLTSSYLYFRLRRAIPPSGAAGAVPD